MSNFFKLLSTNPYHTLFEDKNGIQLTMETGKVFQFGLIEFFNAGDAQKILTRSGIRSGVLLKRLCGSSLWVPEIRLRYLPYLIAILVMAASLSSLLFTRLISLGPLTLTADMLLLPLVFVSADLINELFGSQMTKQAITATAISLLIAAALLHLTLYFGSPVPQLTLSTSPFSISPFSTHTAVEASSWLSPTPPIDMCLVAIDLLCVNWVNFSIYSRLKYLCYGRKLWQRCLYSNLISQPLFVLIWWFALYPNQLLTPQTLELIFCNLLFKVGYFLASLPLIYAVVMLIKRNETLFLKVALPRVNF